MRLRESESEKVVVRVDLGFRDAAPNFIVDFPIISSKYW